MISSEDWLSSCVVEAIENLDLKIQVRSVPEIEHLLSKTVLFRGKKFRPTLCFLMGQTLNLPLPSIQPYARAAEFVHAATLAHDDVIDESQKRRNRPTLNARSTNGRAVLAGDLLLARVMMELSLLGNVYVIQDLSKTVEELVSGEWLQLEARNIVDVNREHLETVAHLKTASLMRWCCGTPVRLAGHGSDLIEMAGQYGEALGVAFQMIDDIIDYDSGGEKPVAQDLREGLVNYVTFEMLDANPKLRNSIVRMIGGESNWSETNPWSESELADACARVRSRARAKLEVADQLLSELSKRIPDTNPNGLQSLRSILVYLRERVR